MTDASGNVTFAQSYDPYGVVLGTSHLETDTSYGFTAEQTDPTGMVYLRARYYAPEMGRFMSRDTWGGDDTMPISYNYWAYANEDPINLSDPTGMIPSGLHYSGDRINEIQREYIESFGLTLSPRDKWTGKWLTNLFNVITRIGPPLRHWLNWKPATLLIDKEGTAVCGKDIEGNVIEHCYSGLTGTNGITFKHTGVAINSEINMLHEFGHLVDNLSEGGNYFTNRLHSHRFTINNCQFWAGWDESKKKYISIPRNGENNVYLVALLTSPIGGGRAWQQLAPEEYDYTNHEQGEDWADIFANGIMHNIRETTEPGAQIETFFKYMERYAWSR